MSIQTITFEGFCDHESGWEFDMPVIMVKPTLICGYGGNSGEIDSMVLDAAIDLLHGKTLPDDRAKTWPYPRQYILRVFRLAKKGKARSGIRYWRRDVQIDRERFPEDDEFPLRITKREGAGADHMAADEPLQEK